MNEMTIDLGGSRNYSIHIGQNTIKSLKDLLQKHSLDDRIFIVTDENVAPLYLKNVLFLLQGLDVSYFIIPAGEKSKSMGMASQLYTKLMKGHHDRNTTLIALGGGVVGDLTGYVAATYMRGVNYVQIPTTLLAQVDSSVGGKVAINFNNIKNLIGAFYHPNFVLIDTNFLQSLDMTQRCSGLGEIIKYGLIQNYEFFKWIEKNRQALLEADEKIVAQAIKQSLKVKRDVVQADERDYDIRRILNFGHTIGHSIEAIKPSYYTHGEAVILGMLYESSLAKRMGLMAKDYYYEVKEFLIDLLKPPLFTESDITKLIQLMKHDKKNKDNRITFILPTGYGRVSVFEIVSEEQIIKTLKDGIER